MLKALFVLAASLLIIFPSLFSRCESAIAAQLPALPNVYMNTSYQLPKAGVRIVASSGAAFQNALNTAQLGDVIELTAGVTYVGPFTLPYKTTGQGWIYVVSSEYASLPEPSHRVNPSDAVHMPKIVVKAAAGSAVGTASRAHHFRFVGIELCPVSGDYTYNVFAVGNGETTSDAMPNNIVIDRCYIHGDATAGSRRGVLMNGNAVAVIDSYISDCKEDGADSQAIASYNSEGPLKIVNNYLEGAGENVIFGGADPSIKNAVMSDIEIRCNLFFKPLSWMSTAWDIKNLLEFKNAQRALVEGNRFENNWPNAQNGFCLLLTPRNQNNTAPWCVVQDITIRYNSIVNVAQGMNILGEDAPNKSQHTKRVLIENNVISQVALGSGGDGRLFQLLGGPTDVIINHNTAFCTVAYMVMDGQTKCDSLVFSNNIVTQGAYGFIGTGTANAMTTLAAFSNPNYLVTHNAVIGGSAKNYPSANYFPLQKLNVGFSDTSSGNWRLLPSSPYYQLGTDGLDLGADFDRILTASHYNGDSLSSSVIGTQQNDAAILYPNPCDEVLRWRSASSMSSPVIEIFDLLGNMILRQKACADVVSIDSSIIPDGSYYCKLSDGDGVRTRMLVVAHAERK